MQHFPENSKPAIMGQPPSVIDTHAPAFTSKAEPMADYPPAESSYTPAVNSYTPATHGCAPVMKSYSPAMNSYLPVMNSYMNGYTPVSGGFTQAMHMHSYTPATSNYVVQFDSGMMAYEEEDEHKYQAGNLLFHGGLLGNFSEAPKVKCEEKADGAFGSDGSMTQPGTSISPKLMVHDTYVQVKHENVKEDHHDTDWVLVQNPSDDDMPCGLSAGEPGYGSNDCIASSSADNTTHLYHECVEQLQPLLQGHQPLMQSHQPQGQAYPASLSATFAGATAGPVGLTEFPPAVIGSPVLFVVGSSKKEERPYAKLIQLALLSAHEFTLPLRDIYGWFELNTDKARAGHRGWQNSIRHNLSMNQAFRRRERFDTQRHKHVAEWQLEAWAVNHPVMSTTRYRKPSAREGRSKGLVIAGSNSRRHQKAQRRAKIARDSIHENREYARFQLMTMLSNQAQSGGHAGNAGGDGHDPTALMAFLGASFQGTGLPVAQATAILPAGVSSLYHGHGGQEDAPALDLVSEPAHKSRLPFDFDATSEDIGAFAGPHGLWDSEEL